MQQNSFELAELAKEANKIGVPRQQIIEARLVWGLRNQDTAFLAKLLPEVEVLAANFDPAQAAAMPNAEAVQSFASYIRALKEFWGSMIVFTEDNPTVPDWNSMLESITKYIAFVPVDRDRLIRHVQRLNRARMEAEALRPRTHGVQQGTALFDIRNHQFK